MNRLPALLAALAAFSLQGCAWFVIGGGAAIVMSVMPRDEAAQPPVIAINSAARLVSNPALVEYTLFDQGADTCSILVEYRVGASGAWRTAAQGAGGDGSQGLASSPSGTLHVFSWDFSSGPDLTPPETLDVSIRIKAGDSSGLSGVAESHGHSVGNSQPAISSIVLPSGEVTGTATIRFVLQDSHSDTAMIRVQFKGEFTDLQWRDATPDDPIALQNLSTSPAGITHLYPWNSDHPDDLMGRNDEPSMRISASDNGTDWGPWTESAGAVSIRNNSPPAASMGAIASTQDGVVGIPYFVSDAENDTVTVVAEYRMLGSSAWLKATAGPGTTPMYGTADPSGTPGVFYWDTAKDGIVGSEATFRVSASDASAAGSAATKDFVIRNSGSATWTLKNRLPFAVRYNRGAAIDGKMYVVGGTDGNTLSTVLAYDTAAGTWTAVANLPSARYRCACAAAGGKLYVIGGTGMMGDLDEVLSYDPVQDAWTSKASLQQGLTNSACAVVGDSIFVVGGTSQGGPVNACRQYLLADDSWVSRAPAPYQFAYHACAAVNGKVYCMGGYNGSFSSRVQSFDPEANAWNNHATAPLADLPGAKSSFAAMAVNGRIWAVGGYDNTSLDEAHVYDVQANAWTAAPSLVQSRSDFGAAAWAGKIYVAGGTSTAVTFMDSAESLDTSRAASWVTGKASSPVPSWNPGAAACNGRIYSIGGFNGTGTTSVRSYDPASDTWSAALAPIPTARWRFCCVSTGGRIFAMGGFGVSAVEIYDPVTDSWSSGQSMTFPRGFTAGAATGGKIYVAGGDNSDRFDAYDPAADSWDEGLAQMPSERHGHACAASGSLVVVVGGDQLSGDGTATLVYDTLADTWKLGARIPTPRQELGCAVVGGIVYAIGGWAGTLHDLATVEAYDPASDTWTRMPDLPAGREKLSCAEVGGRIFALNGGYSSYLGTLEEFRPFSDRIELVETESLESGVSQGAACILGNAACLAGGDNGGTAPVAAVQSASVASDIPASGPFKADPNWTSSSVLPSARRGACAVAGGGLLYVVGGFDAAGAGMPSALSFDPATEQWTALPNMPTARGAFGLVMIGRKIYAFGGDGDDSSAGGKLNSLEAFDLDAMTWSSSLSPMATARSHFGYAADGWGRICAFGGAGNSQDFLSSAERYDIATDSWSALPAMPVALRRTACVFEGPRFVLAGGEILNATLGAVPTPRIWSFDCVSGTWWEEDEPLPVPLMDAAACGADLSWTHRGTAQAARYSMICGGRSATGYSGRCFRIYWK